MNSDKWNNINNLGTILYWLFRINSVLCGLFFVGFFLSGKVFEGGIENTIFLYLFINFLSMTLLSWGIFKVYQQFMVYIKK